MATMKDFSDIPGERDVFVLAWKVVEKHRHTPIDAAHRNEWDGVAGECMELYQCADKHGEPAVTLAHSVASALMDYYKKKLENAAF